MRPHHRCCWLMRLLIVYLSCVQWCGVRSQSSCSQTCTIAETWPKCPKHEDEYDKYISCPPISVLSCDLGAWCAAAPSSDSSSAASYGITSGDPYGTSGGITEIYLQSLGGINIPIIGYIPFTVGVNGAAQKCDSWSNTGYYTTLTESPTVTLPTVKILMEAWQSTFTGGCFFLQEQWSTTNVGQTNGATQPDYAYASACQSDLSVFTCATVINCGTAKSCTGKYTHSPAVAACQAYSSYAQTYASLTQVGCLRTWPSSLFMWHDRYGGIYEDIFVPYAVPFGDAASICELLGGELADEDINSVQQSNAGGTLADFAANYIVYYPHMTIFSGSEGQYYNWNCGWSWPCNATLSSTTEVSSLPFLCRRKKLALSLDSALVANIPLGCVDGNACLVQLESPVTMAVIYTRATSTPLPVTVTLAAGECLSSGVNQTLNVAVGATQSSNSITVNPQCSAGGFINATISVAPGMGFTDNITTSIPVSPLYQVTLSSPSCSTTVFQQQQLTVTATLPVAGFNPTIVIANAALGSASFPGWTSDTSMMIVTVAATAPTGPTSLTFAVSNTPAIFQPATSSCALTVQATGNFTVTYPNQAPIAGVPFNMTVAVPDGALHAVTVQPSTLCDLTFSGSAAFGASSAAGTSVTITAVPSVSITSSTSCTIQWAFPSTNVSPQYPDPPPPHRLLVHPQLDIVYNGLSSTAITVGQSKTFHVAIYATGTSIPAFWYGSIDVALAVTGCGSGLTLTPSTVKVESLTAVAVTMLGTAPGTCTVSASISGPSADQVNSYPSLVTVAVTQTSSVGLTLSAESVYVGQGIVLSASVSEAALSAGQTVSVAWVAWPGSITTPTEGTLTINKSTTTVSVALDALSAGVVELSFNVTAPATFSTAAPNMTASIRALMKPSVVVALPAAISVGPAYAASASVSIPQLPTSGTYTGTVHYNGAEVAVNPSSFSWSSSDSALSAVVVLVTALSSSGSGSSVNVSFSGTAVGFNTSVVLVLGAPMTYRRINILPTSLAPWVYLVSPGTTLTVTLQLSSPSPIGGSDALSVGVSTLSAYLSGPGNMTFEPGSISASLTLTAITEQVDVPITYQLLPTGNATFDSLFNASIPTAFATIYAPRLVSVQCNTAIMYFGPGNTIICNVSVPVIPSSGTVSVIFANGGSTTYFSSTPTSFAFTSQQWQNFVVSPVLAASFYDGQQSTMVFKVIDTSGTYSTMGIDVSVTLMQLNVVQIAFDTTTSSSATFYPKEPFVVVLSLPSPSPSSVITATSPTALTLLSFNQASYDLKSQTVYAVVTGEQVTVGSLTLSFAVSGSATYATQSTTLGVTIRVDSAAFTMQVVETGYTGNSATGAMAVYLNQTLQLNLTLGSTVPLGSWVATTLTYTCGGETVGMGVLLSPAVVNVTGDTSSFTVTVTFTSPCATAAITASALTGPAANRYAAPTAVSFAVLVPKLVTVSVASVVYGGLVNSTTIMYDLGGAPLAPSSVFLTVSNPRPDLLQFTGTFPTFVVASTASSFTASAVVRSALVPNVTVVTLPITLTGLPKSEYLLAQTTVAVEVYPILNVTISGSPLSSTIMLYEGQNTSIGVSLPQVPSNAEGTVLIMLSFAGLVSSVAFTPNVTLSASMLASAFVIEGLSGQDAAALTMTIETPSTPASQYYPPLQQGTLSWMLTVIPIGVVTVTPLASNGLSTQGWPFFVYQFTTLSLQVSLSFPPPAGYGPVTVTATSANQTALVVSADTVTFAEGSGVATLYLNVTGLNPSPDVGLTFTLSAPTIYTQAVQTSGTPGAVVLDDRAVQVTFPSFIYMNGQSHTGTVSITVTPLNGTTLSLYPSFGLSYVPMTIVPNPVTFTTGSPLVQAVSLTGSQAAPRFTMTMNAVQSGDQYLAPPPFSFAVRALETVVVSGLPSMMYVSTSAMVSVTLSRAPPSSGGTLTVTPSFGTTDATFTPASATWTSTSTALTATFTLSANTVSAAAVLEALSLAYNIIGELGIRALENTLPRSGVTSLSLRGNVTRSETARIALVHLIIGSKLLHLDIGFCGMNDSSVVKFAAVLRSRHCNVRSVGLDGASISPPVALLLLDAVCETSKLEHLSLRHVHACQSAQFVSRLEAALKPQRRNRVV